MIIELTGKTRKGKNRVKENGKLWKIIISDKHDMMIESLENKSWRWVWKSNDPNFDCREIKEA